MPKRISLQGKGAELFFAGVNSKESRAASATAEPREDPAEYVDARVHARADAGSGADESIFRGLSDKQRLASSTFRFQPEELERLDLVFEEINRSKPRRISKNDVVRLGLRWLLADYESNRTGSMLAKLMERV